MNVSLQRSRAAVSLGALWLCSLAGAAAPRVAVIAEAPLAAPAQHGLEKLKEALRTKGFGIVDAPAQASYVLLLGLSPNSTAAHVLRDWKAPLPDGAEALTVWHGNYQGKPAAALCGADTL